MQKKIVAGLAGLMGLLSAFGTIVGVASFFTGNESLPEFLGGEGAVEVEVPPADTVFNGSVVCEDGMPIRLQSGGQGEVVASDGLNLKSEPDHRRNQNNVVELAQYSRFTVQGTPRCTGDITWWEVQTDAGQRGWLPENEGNSYQLRPLSP